MSFAGEEYKYSELYFDSWDCSESFDQSYPSTDWPAFNLPEQLNNVVALKVLEASIPNSNNTFQTGAFDVELYEEVGGSSDTWPLGLSREQYYSYSNFPAYLESQMNIASASLNEWTYSVTYNFNTGKLEISNNDTTSGNRWGFTFRLKDYGRREYYKRVLGITGNSYSATFSGHSWESENIISLRSTFYYLNSNNLGPMIKNYLPLNGRFNSESTSSAQICKITRTADNFNSYTNYTDPDPEKWYRLDNITLSGKLDFYITDGLTANQKLKFNGQPFSLKIGVLQYLPSLVTLKRGNEYLDYQDGYDIFDDERNKRFRGNYADVGEECDMDDGGIGECYEELVPDDPNMLTEKEAVAQGHDEASKLANESAQQKLTELIKKDPFAQITGLSPEQEKMKDDLIKQTTLTEAKQTDQAAQEKEKEQAYIEKLKEIDKQKTEDEATQASYEHLAQLIRQDPSAKITGLPPHLQEYQKELQQIPAGSTNVPPPPPPSKLPDYSNLINAYDEYRMEGLTHDQAIKRKNQDIENARVSLEISRDEGKISKTDFDKLNKELDSLRYGTTGPVEATPPVQEIYNAT